MATGAREDALPGTVSGGGRGDGRSRPQRLRVMVRRFGCGRRSDSGRARTGPKGRVPEPGHGAGSADAGDHAERAARNRQRTGGRPHPCTVHRSGTEGARTGLGGAAAGTAATPGSAGGAEPLGSRARHASAIRCRDDEAYRVDAVAECRTKHGTFAVATFAAFVSRNGRQGAGTGRGQPATATTAGLDVDLCDRAAGSADRPEERHAGAADVRGSAAAKAGDDVRPG